MKHYKLILTAFSLALFFSSCQQKEFECWCEDPICGTIETIEAKSQKKTEAECESREAHGSNYSVTCELHVDYNN